MSQEVKITRLMYGWSKHGGGFKGLVQQDKEDEWTCQACAKKQPLQMPSYMIEIGSREYARICSECYNVALREKIRRIQSLIAFVRKKRSGF